MIITTIKIMSFTILIHNTPCPAIGGWQSATAATADGKIAVMHGCHNGRDVVLFYQDHPEKRIYLEDVIK